MALSRQTAIATEPITRILDEIPTAKESSEIMPLAKWCQTGAANQSQRVADEESAIYKQVSS